MQQVFQKTFKKSRAVKKGTHSPTKTMMMKNTPSPTTKPHIKTSAKQCRNGQRHRNQQPDHRA